MVGEVLFCYLAEEDDELRSLRLAYKMYHNSLDYGTVAYMFLQIVCLTLMLPALMLPTSLSLSSINHCPFGVSVKTTKQKFIFNSLF